MSREVELGGESWTSFALSFSSTAAQRTLSLWLCPSTAVETAIVQCTSRWAMARGHRLNTSIVLAAVHGLSGLFQVVSVVEPSLFRPLSPSLRSILASVDIKQHVRRRHKKLQSPNEIKRREKSWTLTKKFDAFAGPGEIKRRDVVPDPQVSPEEIKSRAWKLDFFRFQLIPNGGATDIVFVILFCIAVGIAIAWCCGRCAMPEGHCRNILLFWQRSTAALVVRVGARFEVSLFFPPFSYLPPWTLSNKLCLSLWKFSCIMFHSLIRAYIMYISNACNLISIKFYQ